MFSVKNVEIRFSGIIFTGAVCHEGKFLFLKSVLNSASFDTQEAHIVKKFGLYKLHDPKKI
jgi:hypothetical protein